MELVVDDTYYFIETVNDCDGNHYVKDGLTTVLDFRKPLVVIYKKIESHIHPALLKIRQDQHGNDLVAVPLSANIMFIMRDLFYVDASFIKRFEGTSLHEFVDKKEGCYAITAFEVIENATSAFEVKI